MKLKIINSQTNEELQEFDLASAIRSDGKCIVGRSATSGLVLEREKSLSLFSFDHLGK